MEAQYTQRIHTFLTRRSALWKIPFFLIVGSGIAISLFRLISLAFLQRIDDVTAPIFWMMGRAILNGLTPYVHIYETKPPGLFVLSAISHALFDTPLLANILHVILLFLVPILFVLHTKRRAISTNKETHVLLMTLSFLGIALLMRYLLPHPGVWSPDYYGAVFAMLYLLIIADKKELSRKRIAVATSAFACSIAFKEPFFLSMFAGALILLQKPRALFRGFVLPAAMTGVIGVTILAMIGWLSGFFTIYLPSMFGGYVQRHSMPLWERSIVFDPILTNLGTLSPLLPFLILAFFLFLLFFRENIKEEQRTVWTTVFLILSLVFLLSFTSPGLSFALSQKVLIGFGIFLIGSLMRMWEKKKERFLLLSLLFSSGALLLTSYAWCTTSSPIYAFSSFFFQLSSATADFRCVTTIAIPGVLTLLPLGLLPFASLRREDQSFFFSTILLLASISLLHIFTFVGVNPARPERSVMILPVFVLTSCAIAIFSKQTQYKRRISLKVGVLFLAFFLASLAVGLGADFQNQHYLAAVPLYAALLLFVIKVFCDLQHAYRTVFLRMFVAFAALATFFSYPYSSLFLGQFKENLTESHERRMLAMDSAEKLDAIMDRCKIEKYYMLKNVHERNSFYGFTQHTPGNYFFFAGLETINNYHTILAERETANFSKAEIVIVSNFPITTKSPAEEDIHSFLNAHFTTEPPPCASGLPTVPKRILLYPKI